VIRAGLARKLLDAIDDAARGSSTTTCELAELVSVGIDRGLGNQAIAAIMAVPSGPRRDLEVALWVDRALRADVEHVVVAIPPNATDDLIDAHAQFACALELARRER